MTHPNSIFCIVPTKNQSIETTAPSASVLANGCPMQIMFMDWVSFLLNDVVDPVLGDSV